MAEAKKSGALNLPLMIVAFLAIGGFLYWLSVVSEPTDVAVAEEDPRAALAVAVPVSPVQFAEDPGRYVGERVRIPNVRVSAIMGMELFWFNLANEEETPYLVQMDREWIDSQVQILPDDVLTLTGTVHAMSDSVLEAMERAGAFTEEGQRGLVDAVETFIAADELELHSERAGEEQEEEDPPSDEDDTGAS